MVIQKAIELYPQQYDFVACDDLYTGFIGGIASGKSFAGSVKSMRAGREHGTLGMVIAPTYTMLRDVCWRAIMEFGRDIISKANTSQMAMTIRGGGEILFRSADNPERLRGANLDWAWMDEGGSCPVGTWEIMIGRLRAGGKAGRMWVTSTPKGRNWLYKQASQMTIFRAATMDNPHLAAEFVEGVKRSYTGEFARQELMGEFVSMEGVVYPQFSRDVHIVKRDISEFHRFGLAIDEGYTNPAVILAIGTDGDGRLHIFDCWYERGKLQEAVVKQAGDMFSKYSPCGMIAVDAAAAGLIADLKNNGLPAVARKGRVLDGIAKIQNMLTVQGDGKPRLTIDPSCEALIHEFESYVWKEGKDEPVKEWDHGLDCLRYYVCEPEKRLFF